MVTAKATITRHCAGNAHDFLQRYERIRTTRSKELDPMVYVLSKVRGSGLRFCPTYVDLRGV